jgi:hypothetical protein
MAGQVLFISLDALAPTVGLVAATHLSVLANLSVLDLGSERADPRWTSPLDAVSA